MTHLPFTKLIVWQAAMTLVKHIYLYTRQFPSSEFYGLSQQMRRAAISIPSNIAEGSQRTSDKEFSYFLRVAKGSLAELETQILLSIELKYMKKVSSNALMEDIHVLSKMLRSLIAKVSTR